MFASTCFAFCVPFCIPTVQIRLRLVKHGVTPLSTFGGLSSPCKHAHELKIPPCLHFLLALAPLDTSALGGYFGKNDRLMINAFWMIIGLAFFIFVYIGLRVGRGTYNRLSFVSEL
jgi:hypothetical protein